MFDLFENVIDLAQSKKTGGKLPFGEETTVKEVLAEQKAENLEYMDGLGYLVPQSIGLVVGGKYIVTYNGVDYECTGIDGSVANSTGNVFLGDISLVTPGQEEIYDEPFMLVDMPEDGVTGIVPTAAQVAFESISIRQEVTTVQKMSGKYVEGMGYEEKNTTMLLEKQELAFATDAGNGVYKSDITLTCDMEYVYANSIPAVVVFDGVEHKLPFQSGSAFGFGNATLAMKAVGVPEEQWAAMGVVDTGEDFMVVYNGAKNYLEIYCSDNENHTVEVYLLEETIHPIDQKFLPSGGNGGGGGVHAFIEKQGNEYALYLETAYDGAFAPHMVLSNGFDTFLADGASISKMMSAYPADDGTIVMAFVDAKTGKVLRLAYDENNGTIEVVDAVS